jgi:hypothetical protein
MTAPPTPPTPPPAVVDGVDVDAVAAAVHASPGVSRLDGGRHGETVTYLPGRTVAGVVVGGGRVRVQIRSQWGTPAPAVAAWITAALAPLTGHRPIDVVIADIDDPPSAPPFPAPQAGPPSPAEPPGPPPPGPPPPWPLGQELSVQSGWES